MGDALVTRTAVLLAEFGSAVLSVAVAVLVSAPIAFGLTTIVTVALALADKDPIPHVTTPADCEQLPAVELAETKVTFAGNVSLSVTPAASDGPRFVTTTV